MGANHPTKVVVTADTTAHLGYAQRSGEKEWIVMDRHGNSLATIRSLFPDSPETFRCEPWADILYVDAVEAGDFLILLDYALKNFAPT